jgi:hypothetical protein
MDVVYKTVLRDMKRFYVDDFNVRTSFIKCKRTNKYDLYASCIIEYISEQFPEKYIKNK